MKNAPKAHPRIPPRRRRLLAGDFILDVVEMPERPGTFSYMVHRRSSGEVLTLGEARSFDDAEKVAVWSVRQITGRDPGFTFAPDRSAA